MLAYAHIEKCGGTCLIDLLRRSYGLRHFDVIPRRSDAMIYPAQDAKTLLAHHPFVRSVSGHSIRLASQLECVAEHVRYVTCLRDPIRRYLSEYAFLVDRVGLTADLETWLGREDRHNFQTKAIAGTDDVELAKNLLDNRFAAVGVLEDFDGFLSDLSTVAYAATGIPMRRDYRVRNSQSDGHRRTKRPALDERLRARVRDANRNDLELYRYARETVIPRLRCAEPSRTQGDAPPPASWVADKLRLLTCQVYRNLVYKPSVGRLPVPHRLPEYVPAMINRRSTSAGTGPASESCRAAA